ncbi:MAG: twin-arginine translocase TatA/TatE family subunit [Halobacteriales archaeon]|nr:twin-arginine translocase TatA/TatE family subunit [Halobacteriales archaeon]
MSGALLPLFIGGLGPLEIGVILLLLVLLFGADKIPKLARSAGDAKKEFDKANMEAKKEVKEYEKELEAEMAENEKEGTVEKGGSASSDASVEADGKQTTADSQ